MGQGIKTVKPKNKGGRPSLRQEIQTKELIELSVKTLWRVQKSKDMSLADKAKYALPVVVKHIKQQVDVTGNNEVTLQIVHYNAPNDLPATTDPMKIANSMADDQAIPIDSVTKQADPIPVELSDENNVE